MADCPENNPYPTDVDAHITVEDELLVHFRALHACEEAPIRSLYERLGTESRYRRFLSPLPSLPDTVVRDLARVDHCRSLAIVAEDEAHNRDVIALASYAAVDENLIARISAQKVFTFKLFNVIEMHNVAARPCGNSES